MANTLQTAMSRAFSWDSNFSCLEVKLTEVCSCWSKWLKFIINSGCGLVPKWCQAISINHDPVHWCMHAQLRGRSEISVLTGEHLADENDIRRTFASSSEGKTNPNKIKNINIPRRLALFLYTLQLLRPLYNDVIPGLAWTSNYIHCKVWDELTCSFPNFNGAICEWISNFIPHFTEHVFFLSMPRLKLFRVSKVAPGGFASLNRVVILQIPSGPLTKVYTEYCFCATKLSWGWSWNCMGRLLSDQRLINILL